MMAIGQIVRMIEVIDDVMSNFDTKSAKKNVIKIKCRNCGTLNDEDSTYCKSCGEKL